MSPTANTPASLAARARALLEAAAVTADAAPMAAYMKGVQPFLGAKKPLRVPIARELARDFAPDSPRAMCARIDALWCGEFREQRYLALDLLWRWKEHTTAHQLDWLVELVRSGAWWDLVDELAIRPIGRLWQIERRTIERAADRWIDDGDLWLRRTAIIGQLKHRAQTDTARLFRYATERAHEKEFFIRKAIGWALREHAYTDAEAVRTFLAEQGQKLSGLTRREAAKHL